MTDITASAMLLGSFIFASGLAVAVAIETTGRRFLRLFDPAEAELNLTRPLWTERERTEWLAVLHTEGEILYAEREGYITPDDAKRARQVAAAVGEMPLKPPAKPRKCKLPPDGWECTREGGHAGPCAAISESPVWIIDYDLEPEEFRGPDLSYALAFEGVKLSHLRNRRRAEHADVIILHRGDTGRLLKQRNGNVWTFRDAVLTLEEEPEPALRGLTAEELSQWADRLGNAAGIERRAESDPEAPPAAEHSPPRARERRRRKPEPPRQDSHGIVKKGI